MPPQFSARSVDDFRLFISLPIQLINTNFYLKKSPQDNHFYLKDSRLTAFVAVVVASVAVVVALPLTLGTPGGSDS